MTELSERLRRVAAEPWKHDGGTWPDLMREAAAKLERYDELFRWSNENCQDCAEGRQPRHPQPLPSPDDAEGPHG